MSGRIVPPFAARRVSRLAPVAAVLVTLVLAHDLVFLARYGSVFGEALAHVGHGDAWTGAVLGSLGLGAGLLLAGLLQLVRLRRVARRIGARSTPGEPGPRQFVSSWLALWTRLFGATVLLLTVQENLERASVGLPTPGPGLLLSPEYPFGLAIVGAVAFAVGFVAALLQWRREVLVARLRDARPRGTRVPSARRPVGALSPGPRLVPRGRLSLRAPPISPAFLAQA